MASRTLHLRTAASLGLIVALSVGVGAQTNSKPIVPSPTPIRVDGKIIKGYIEYMAADSREGRQSLTPGYEKTAEWAAAKFKEWGLKPAGDNGTFLQNVPITGQYSGFAWTTGIPDLTVDGRRFYVKDDDFRLSDTSTPGADAAGEIVFVGYGISAPAKGLDEYAGLDVKGRIVVAFKGTPKSAPAARGMFGVTAPEPKDVEAWTDESKDLAKIQAAYDKGAAAIVLFSPEKLAPAATAPLPGIMPAMVTGGPSQPAEPPVFTRPFLVVTDINERVFRHVMYRDPQESSRGFVGRIDQIRRDIRDKKARSQATGVKAQIKGYATTTFYGEKYKNNISHNVIGKIEGTDPKLKDQYIVIGGHMDHTGMTNGVIYNGADDDASGTAVTMEMARLIAANAATIKPKRTIVFALWCAEEMGLIGSNYWTKTPSDGVKMENAVVNFNCDMVGLGERIGAPGALNFPTIYDVIMRNQHPDVAKVVDPSTAGPGGSDYSGFIEQGVEALALMTSGGVGHPDYHDAGDDTEKIDPEILRKTGQFVLQGVINVANDTTATLIIPDRLHLYNGLRMPLLNLNTVRSGPSIVVINGVVQQPVTAGPRFNISLSDVNAFGGNVALVDVAAKLMSIGRVDVRPDAAWFASTGLTDRGKAALKAFEAAGVALNFINPPKALLESLLENAKRGFIVSDLAAPLDADLAKRIKEKNALVAIDCDLSAPSALAGRLIDLKKLMSASDNLLLVSRDATTPADPAARKKIEEAKQQLYLPLIKAGWTKDEIYALVGMNPALTMEQMMAGTRGPSGLPGNLKKLSQ